MAIPPVPAPAEVPAAVPEAAPAPVVTPPAAAPWAADIAAALAAADPAAALDTYMREKNQPYVTKLEERAKAAEDKSWLFDQMNDDPVAGLQELAEQVWGPDVATRMLELVTAGVPVEGAQAQAASEAAAAAGASTAQAVAAGEAAGAVDLSKLPPEVQEAVEFAKAEKAAREAAATAKTEADAQAAIEAEYATWHAQVLKDNPDIIADTLHAYVASHDDMEAGLAAYRAVYPAPAAAPPPATIGGSTTGGIPDTRPAGGSMRDIMADVWDKMASR